MIRKYHNLFFEELLADRKVLFMPRVLDLKSDENDLEIIKVFDKEEDAIDFIYLVMDGYIDINKHEEVPYMKEFLKKINLMDIFFL